MSVSAKAGAIVAEVEGEPLESSCVGAGEGRSSHRRSRRRDPSNRAVARAVAVVVEVEAEPLEPSFVDEGEGRSQRGRLMHVEDPSKVTYDESCWC